MMLLKKIGKISTGNTPSKKHREYYNSDDIGFVKPDSISDTVITEINKTSSFISENAREKARIASKGSILITCIGSVGKVGIVTDGEYAFNQQINAIMPNKDVNQKYLAYNLLYNKQRLINIANAPVVPIVNKTQLENFEINFDSNIDTQKKIVEQLDGIALVIDKRKKQLDALDELIKARFVEMFGKEKNKVKMVDICSIITDGTHESPKFVNEGIPFIFVSNISDNKIMYDADKYIDKATYDVLIKRTPIEIGDIILSTVGSYGHPAVVKSDKKFLFQRHIAYLKPKREMVNSEYLHTMIMMDYVQHQINLEVKGIAQKTLNLSAIKSLDVLMPSLSQQNEFAFFKIQVDKSKSVIEKSLKELETLQASLMQKYFS